MRLWQVLPKVVETLVVVVAVELPMVSMSTMTTVEIMAVEVMETLVVVVETSVMVVVPGEIIIHSSPLSCHYSLTFIFLTCQG
jgi:hypothetical protein